MAMDLRTGFDFRKRADRNKAWQLVKTHKPALLVLGPPRTTFSPLRRLSDWKRNPTMVEMEQQEGMEHWEFSIELAKYQHRQRRGFLLDHPEWVTSWNTNSAESLIVMDGVYYIAVDMYQYKLMTKDRLLARKPTGLVTNLWPIVKQMLKKRGSGDHPHQPLIGGRAQAAAQYTPQFVRAVLQGLQHHLCVNKVQYWVSGHPPLDPPVLPGDLHDWADHHARAIAQPLSQYVHGEADLFLNYLVAFPSHKIFGERPSRAADAHVGSDPVMERAQAELRPIAESSEIQELARIARHEQPGRVELAPDLRREIFRLHRNLGHPARDSFLRALRHANAREDVITYVKKDFSRPICDRQQRPNVPRPGHLVRSLQFNETVRADTIFLEFAGETYAFLNIVCWGTSLQIVEYMPQKTAAQALKAFTNAWLTPFGLPSLLILDQGTGFIGREFQHHVSDLGVLVHFTDTRSPWQASKTEMSGDIFKTKLKNVMDELYRPRLVRVFAMRQGNMHWEEQVLQSQWF